MIRVDELLVDWTTASGAGKVSVLYVAETTTNAFRLNLFDMLSALAPRFHNTTKFNIRASGRQIDSATGRLTGEWVQGNPLSGSGSASGEPLPDASQGLIRWNTGVVINGRFARGRTFLPGLAASSSAGGNLSGVAQGLIQTQASTLLTKGTGLLVWHRPVNGQGGSNSAVTSATVWNELAVLRRRRGATSV